MIGCTARHTRHDGKLYTVRGVDRASTEFRQCDCGKLVPNFVTDPSPERGQGAIGRAAAIDAILGFAIAGRGGQEAVVECLGGVPDRDLIRIACELITPGGASCAVDEPRDPQLAHEFGGVDSGNAFGSRNRSDRDR